MIIQTLRALRLANNPESPKNSTNRKNPQIRKIRNFANIQNFEILRFPMFFSMFFSPGNSTEACSKNVPKMTFRKNPLTIRRVRFSKKEVASENDQKSLQNEGNSTILTSGATENLGLRWILTGSRQLWTDSRRCSSKLRRFSVVFGPK